MEQQKVAVVHTVPDSKRRLVNQCALLRKEMIRQEIQILYKVATVQLYANLMRSGRNSIELTDEPGYTSRHEEEKDSEPHSTSRGNDKWMPNKDSDYNPKNDT